MNIFGSETILNIDAKIYTDDEKRNIIYSFIEYPYELYIDKKEMILAQIQACERLLKYVKEDEDKTALGKEISYLKLSLDMTTY